MSMNVNGDEAGTGILNITAENGQDYCVVHFIQ